MVQDSSKDCKLTLADLVEVTFKWMAGALKTPCLFVFDDSKVIFKGAMVKKGQHGNNDEVTDVSYELTLVRQMFLMKSLGDECRQDISLLLRGRRYAQVRPFW